MGRFIGRRLLEAIPVLVLSSLVVFSMLHLVPGDPVDAMVGASGFQGSGRQETIDRVRRDLGLDQPLPVQYGRWAAGALHGDLGTSYIRGQSVSRLIRERLPSTLQLAAASLLLTAIVGLTLGIVAALKHNTWLDSAIMAVALVGVSIPAFWFGILLILAFSVSLHWFPATGAGSLKQLILPAFALGYEGVAVVARLTRSSLLEVMNRPYITTARAKGLRERAVTLHHGLRNALIPVVTVMGLQVGHLLAGSVVIETVFARQGIGQLAIEAIRGKDYPLVQGIVLFTAVTYVLINMMVDLLYGYLDPQIRVTR
jgi:ABC-type dipeptide/oligopeptide/nickel transport system permease component